jgi:opacity protein-like surface antigen
MCFENWRFSSNVRFLSGPVEQTAIAAVTAALIAAAATPSYAQIASAPPTATPSGWSFAVTPYAWLPTISSTFDATGPRGRTVSTSIDAGIGDYISDINFAAMIGAAVRYDRFSVMTDFVYLNASLTTSVSHLSTVNFGPGPIDIPRSQQLGTGTRLANSIWTLAGGYTLLQGDWGYLDAVAGLRMLTFNSTTNYLLTADILAPDRTIALSRGGSVGLSKTLLNGIGGITGRINIPNSKFYLPFYFDAGGGGVPFTWQIYGGLGYAAASWVDVSAGYRYLTFQNGGSGTGVRNLSLGGAILVANFRF